MQSLDYFNVSHLRRYCNDEFDPTYKATIGVDFEVEKFQILGRPFSLQLWVTHITNETHAMQQRMAVQLIKPLLLCVVGTLQGTRGSDPSPRLTLEERIVSVHCNHGKHTAHSLWLSAAAWHVLSVYVDTAHALHCCWVLPVSTNVYQECEECVKYTFFTTSTMCVHVQV